jgi:hypothetical protein
MSKNLVERIYLDWNIFNKLEHLTSLTEEEADDYGYLDSLITDSSIIAPYSNGHINDLIRGYEKDPSFTPGHLANITRLSRNICIAQYWGESKAKWHIREPEGFLHSRIEESNNIASSYGALYDTLNEPLATMAFELKKTSQRLTPVPANFKSIYATNPIFNAMYPRTKIEMNMLALCEDLYAFGFNINNDFQLYKHYRKYLAETKLKFPQYKNLFNAMIPADKPKYLTWEDLWDGLEPQFKETSNAAYDRIMGLFTTTDLKGYRQDNKFPNLLDDALHCFYAAHCNYFITIDAKCYDKAKLVYDKLKITTKVFTPSEFKIWRDQQ